MTRTLANTDLRQSTNDDAVFFDVLSFKLLWWPQAWTKWIAVAAFIVLMAGAANRVRDRDTGANAITLGVFSFFLSVIAAAVLGWAFASVASLRSAGATWVAQPGPMIAVMWLIGFATAIVCATWLRPRAGFEGLFIGHALCWTALSIALAMFLPGGAYLAALPAVAFAVCTLAASAEVSVIVTSAIAALLWFPIITALYDLVGHVALGAIAAIVALVSTTFTALISVRTAVHGAIVAAMMTTVSACIAMQLLLPPYTSEWPRRTNIQRLALNPPQCEGGSVLRCRSMRGAQRLGLMFYAPDLISLRINGVVPPQQPPKFKRRLPPGWHSISVRGAAEAQIEIVRRSVKPLDVEVSDWSFGLPPEAAALIRARAAAGGVPSNEGDGVVARRKVLLK